MDRVVVVLDLLGFLGIQFVSRNRHICFFVPGWWQLGFYCCIGCFVHYKEPLKNILPLEISAYCSRPLNSGDNEVYLLFAIRCIWNRKSEVVILN